VSRRRDWELRQIREEQIESRAAQAQTEHMAAQAVFELFEQTKTGRFILEDIETPLLDALEAILAAELQDRDRRERLERERELAPLRDDTPALEDQFPEDHHVAALHRGKGAGDY
jgi:hypothetical protein